MAGTEFRVDGLDRMEQQLARMAEQEYPAEFRKLVVQIAYELQGRVKQNTNRVTGILQDSWKVGPIQKVGDTYFIEVYTNVEYALPYNYGHRTPGGGFMPGAHTMELSLAEVQKKLNPFLRAWLSNFIATHQL